MESEKDVRIVLVRPRNPINIGAAARAMMNFGFEDLVVVAPYEPVWRESKAALKAQKLLAQARAVPRLLDAIEDRTLVAGTSSLSRRETSQPVAALEELPARWKRRKAKDKVAVLFGSEKTGLSNEDLSFCHCILRIPTTSQCPSMNLGQAVAVCCYELKRLLAPAEPQTLKHEAPAWRLASVGEVARLVDEIEKLLWTTAEPKRRKDSPASTGPLHAKKVRLRQMLLRWPLRPEDLSLALGVLRDLQWRLRKTSE